MKWATHSAGKWASPGRAGRRGKIMMPEVAHMGQEERALRENLTEPAIDGQSAVGPFPVHYPA